jgi:HEAT repeat protein
MNGKCVRVELALAAVVTLASSCHCTKRGESTLDLIHDLQSNAQIQRQAVVARILGERKALQAVPPLINALKEPEPVRLSAARALGKIRDPRAVPALIVLLKDDYPEIREAAARALGELNDSRAIQPLLAAMKAGNEAAGPALASIGEPAVPALVASLAEADGSRAAVQALIKIGKPAARPLIEAFTAYTDAAQISVARALAEIDDPRVTDALNAALRNGDVRLAYATYKFLLRNLPPDGYNLLIEALRTYGHEQMAEDFLRSGKPRLVAAAKNWAADNFLSIETLTGGAEYQVDRQF